MWEIDVDKCEVSECSSKAIFMNDPSVVIAPKQA